MRRLIAAGVLVLLPACGGGSSPTAPAAPPPTTLPPRAQITVTFTPDPVVATPATGTDPTRPFHATYTMTIRETSGLSGNVNFWNETLENPVTGLFSGTVSFGADRVIALAGTNHLQAMGSLNIARSYDYGPGGNSGTGRGVISHVVVQVTDDKGNVINVEGTIRII
ncbi:MAG TPA: hypothetical protein VKI41_10975 [Vicinamibacteria bacterium]|nr:hypothetical protein [Vicinamibacteria bacterium]